jgi:hypothetical protein
MDALGTRFPGCHIAVVGTAGSEMALAEAGVATGDGIIYPAPRIQPLAFVRSRTARAVRQWRYDRVAILWNDAKGRGQGNIAATALALRPRGYLAITPDGAILERAPGAQTCSRCLRALASLTVGAALGVFLYAPAYVASYVGSAFRRTS